MTGNFSRSSFIAKKYTRSEGARSVARRIVDSRQCLASASMESAMLNAFRTPSPLIAIAVVVLLPFGAFAQDDGSPTDPTVVAPAQSPSDGASPEQAGETACLSGPGRLSEEAVAQFLGNPQGLLDRHPESGLALSNEVRTLAASDIGTVDPLIGLASTASSAVKSAVGSGLSRAALVCVEDHPELANLIQQRVAALGDGELVTAFLSGTDEVQTAAVTAPAAPAAIGPTAGGTLGGATGGIGGGDTTGSTGSSGSGLSSGGQLPSLSLNDSNGDDDDGDTIIIIVSPTN
ncbi:hypothetical protein [Consotaella aegiceratis]|uniref:hypothetical protein n=1 Tax=Consotaella aegiceratis TaxID=3097961 RepID=UPI002F3E55E3